MDKESLKTIEDARNLIIELRRDIAEVQKNRDEWELRYWQVHNEIRKSNKGIKRLVKWKEHNKGLISSVRREQKKLAKKAGDNEMIYSTVSSQIKKEIPVL